MAEAKPNEDAAFRATAIVLGLLPQVAGFVVGFCALAFVAGWFEAAEYYAEIGAGWALPLVPPAQIMRASAWIVILVGGVAIPSILGVIQRTSTRKGLYRWSQAFLVLAGTAYAIAFLGDGHLSRGAVHAFAIVTCACWAVGVGLTVGELVASLADNDARWHEYHALLIWIIIFVGLQQAPSLMGRTTAQATIESASSLPKVALKAPEAVANDWRLITTTGDRLLLIAVPDRPDNRKFNLVDPSEVAWIERVPPPPPAPK